MILTERSEVDSESRRQPAVFIARSATDARARALPSLLSLPRPKVWAGQSLVPADDRRLGQALTDLRPV